MHTKNEEYIEALTDLAVEIKHVTKDYQSHGVLINALKDVTFSVQAGRKICLVGRSGSGKTTLSRIIYGQEPPSSGSVYLFGKNPYDSYRKRRKDHCKTIQLVQQNSYLSFDPLYTVLNSLSYPLKIYHPELSKKQRIEAVYLLLHNYGLFELMELLNRRPSELSGGQLQKLALIRALIINPAILIADEPTAMLDILSTKEIARIINLVPQSTTVLCISHSKIFFDNFANPIVEILDGTIVSQQ